MGYRRKTADAGFAEETRRKSAELKAVELSLPQNKEVQTTIFLYLGFNLLIQLVLQIYPLKNFLVVALCA